jgi:phage gpG-like protein
MAKKKITAADLKKLVKEAHKLDPSKPIPKSVASRMDKTIAELASGKKPTYKPSGGLRGGAGIGGMFGVKNR